MYSNVITKEKELEINLLLRNEISLSYRYPNIVDYKIGLMNHLLNEASKSKNRKVLLDGGRVSITEIFEMFQPYLTHINIGNAFESTQIKIGG